MTEFVPRDSSELTNLTIPESFFDHSANPREDEHSIAVSAAQIAEQFSEAQIWDRLSKLKEDEKRLRANGATIDDPELQAVLHEKQIFTEASQHARDRGIE